MRRNLLILFVVSSLLMLASPAYAATCTSTGNGAWNNPAIWSGCGGGIPQAGDDVVIQAGNVIDINTNPNNLTSLSMGAGSILTDSVATNFTAGNLTVGNSANLTLDAGGTLTVTGTWTQSGTFNHSGTVIMDGVSKTINTNWATNFNNLQINNGITLNQTSTGPIRATNMLVNGTFNATNGTVQLNNAGATLSGTGTASFFNLSTGGTPTAVAASMDFSVANNFTVGPSASFTANAGTTMTVIGAGTWSQNGAFTHNGTLNINGTTVFNTGNWSIQVTDININGSLTASNGPGAFRVAGNWSNNGTFNPNNDEVVFNGAASSIGGANPTIFYDLGVGGSPSALVVNQGIMVNRNFAVGSSGSFTANAGTTMTVTGAGTWIQNGAFTHNGTLNINGTTALNTGSWSTNVTDININGSLTANNGAGSLRVSGNWVNSGTFDPNNDEVIFNATSSIGGANPTTFYNLTIGGTPTVTTVNQNITVNNNFTIGSSGIFTANAGTTITYNNNGTWSQNGAFTSNGTVIINDTRTINSGAWTPQFTNLTINGNVNNTTNVNIAGDLLIPGMFTVAGTTTFNGGSQNITVNNSSGANFNNVTVNVGTILTETIAADNINVSGTILNNGTINKVAKNILAGGGYNFGLANGNLPTGTDFITVSAVGTLSQLQVSWIDGNHPSADIPQQTGSYWIIAPTGGGYTADLTLPHNNLATTSVCQYSGAGITWNCNTTSSTTSSVTQAGITSFDAPSNVWTVGAGASADLAIVKTQTLLNDVAGNSLYDPGDTVRYTITVTNNGVEDIASVTITDVLPAGVTYVTDAPSAGAYAANIWSGFGLANTASEALTIDVTINAGTEGATVNNTASITSATYPDPVAGNNSSTAGFTVYQEPTQNPQPQPAIAVFDPAISKLGFFITGEQIEWVITISNVSSTAGNNVQVVDTIAPNLRVDNVVTPRGDVSIDGQTVTVSFGTLQPGETIVFSIFTTVIDGTTANNTACILSSDLATQECSEAIPISALPATGER